MAALDFTELTPTGNLYKGGDAIEAAEMLWAEAAGMESCFFLTDGSTQGNQTALALAAKPGETVLLGRDSHRSVITAAALLDLRPVWLCGAWDREDGLYAPVTADGVDKALTAHPDCRTVLVTAPSYYGVMPDLPTIAEAVHAHRGRLIVDGAHGAHLPFLGYTGYRSADLVVMSAHKTLPAMGQAALLFANGYEPADLRAAARLFGTSSPSYPMMASLDAARAYMTEQGGADAYRVTAERTASLRAAFPTLRTAGETDPCRFVLRCSRAQEIARALESRHIYPEMSDLGHVVFICTPMNREEDFRALEAALRACGPLGGDFREPVPPAELPEPVLTPREAVFAPADRLPLEDAVGKVAAEPVAPYPPGIPVIAPGERIEKKHVAYLQDIAYNTREKIRAVDGNQRACGVREGGAEHETGDRYRQP